MNTLCLMGLGLGGKLTSGGFIETQGVITKQFPQIKVLRYDGERLSNVIQMIKDQYVGWDLIIGGYSWGSDNTSIIAAAVPNKVKFIFALQPSVYYPTTPLKTNVREALCVYNPYWFETMGLGFQKLALADGNTVTKLNLVQTSDSHPSVQYDLKYRQMILDGISRNLT